MRLAIIGDLHYEEPEREFLTACQQRLKDLRADAAVSLGDLGGYTHPGTALSFREGREFFDGLGVPWHALLGNHDLECEAEFASDGAVLEKWMEVLGKPAPYCAVELGPLGLIFLSTTSFRDNAGSEHEVHIDEEQFRWFEAALAAAEGPVAVFSHAPILGSGLRITQSLHLRVPNAWLNHSDRPERFMEVVRRHPRVKFWFSAHNHLGQSDPDTLSRVGECVFVHTGVFAKITRDGARHSRVLDVNEDGDWRLHTLDHVTGELLADAEGQLEDGWRRLRAHMPPAEGKYFPPPPFPAADAPRLGGSVFLIHRGMLVEYDLAMQAPIGVVRDDMEGRSFRTEGGHLIIAGPEGEGAAPQRPDGRFFKTFYPNRNAPPLKV